jgi:hypothetical protein
MASTSSFPWSDVADLPMAHELGSADTLTRLRQRRQAGDDPSIHRAAAADGRLERLCRQLRQPLFELSEMTASGNPTAASGGGGPVSSATVYAPVDGWAKLPHGVWLREATAVAVDSTDR